MWYINVGDDMKNIFKKENNNKKFSTVEMVFLVVTTCLVSLYFGTKITYKEVKQSGFISEIEKVYDEITTNYYTDINEDDLLSGAINGMTSALDKYSTVIDSSNNENFYLTLEGSYSGVGIEISTDNDNNIIIVGILSNSPAEKAGLEAGDIIKKIDNIDLADKDYKYVSSYIRENSDKNEYKLEILRNNELLNYDLKKDTVVIKSVASKIIEKENKKIGYIYISIFSNTTVSQFKENLDDLKKQGIDSLIIDVRENSGGHLTTAVGILSELISSEKVIYQIEKDNKKSKFYSLGKKDFEYPIVIIQNSNSASAAEMLSISLRENLNAVVVGETSYGKGTVQELNYLSNGDSYKYTTKKWLSPNGNWIEETGVVPDVEVELNEEYMNNPTDETDNQLQTAISELLKEK